MKRKKDLKKEDRLKNIEEALAFYQTIFGDLVDEVFTLHDRLDNYTAHLNTSFSAPTKTFFPNLPESFAEPTQESKHP
jgi:hypothetical protein